MKKISIFGSGPATIFFCSKFFNSNFQIDIYEKGNENKIIKDKIILNNGGPFEFYKNNNPEFVTSFFGTCSLWKTKGVGGKLQKFDSSDLKINDWPIDYDELNHYYNEVETELSKVLKKFGRIEVKKKFNYNILKSFSENFQIKVSNGVLVDNFKKVYEYYYKKIHESSNINFISDTELKKINFSQNNNDVLNATIKKDGIEKNIKSDFYILSCGCLNNNRVLIKSFGNNSEFIQKYNIGKNISFHPSYEIGNIKLKKKISYNKIKKQLHYKNEQLFLKLIHKNIPINSAIAVKMIFDYPKTFLSKILFKFLKYINSFSLNLIFEHLGSKKSFIQLKDENDIKINSDFSQMNAKYFEDLVNIYKKNIIDFCHKNDHIFIENQNLKIINFETNNHHHGGTVFGLNEDLYPVDENNKLRNCSNLFINGSSVFPSSSVYGPTLTIIALSLRLGDKIKKLNDKSN